MGPGERVDEDAESPSSHTSRATASKIPRPLRRKILWTLSALLLVNAATWVASVVVLQTNSTYSSSSLATTLLLAWTLGLRHAVDADHIAAIDNVTRKLTVDGRQPVTVGLWFALGHSTIVVVATIVTIVGVQAVGATGWGILGTIVSATFLFVIAAVNAIALVGVVKAIKRQRKGANVEAPVDITQLTASFGLLGRLLRPLIRFIDSPWKMYPLGVLFGLGFDTATEISLLAIVASQGSNGVPIGLTMLLPVLFTAGMSLIDTLDGILMLGAYSWATIHPSRKLYYNFTVTLLSVLIALFIGIIEVLSIVAEKQNLEGGVWDVVGNVDDKFGVIGYIVIGTFLFVLILSATLWRVYGVEEADKIADTASDVAAESSDPVKRPDRKEDWARGTGTRS